MTLKELINDYLKERQITKKDFTASIGIERNKFSLFSNGHIGNYEALIEALENNKEVYVEVLRHYRTLMQSSKKVCKRKQTLQERNPRVFY